MYLRTNSKGEVEYLMKTGKDMVKSSTLESNVRRMIDQAETKEITDDYPGFPLCVNGKFYFPELPEPDAPVEEKPKRKK